MVYGHSQIRMQFAIREMKTHIVGGFGYGQRVGRAPITPKHGELMKNPAR